MAPKERKTSHHFSQPAHSLHPPSFPTVAWPESLADNGSSTSLRTAHQSPGETHPPNHRNRKVKWRYPILVCILLLCLSFLAIKTNSVLGKRYFLRDIERRPGETMTFIITCGHGEIDAVTEMSPLLKSIIVLSGFSKVRFEFLTDRKGKEHIEKLFAPPFAASKQVCVRINVLDFSWLAKRLADLKFIVSHHSGVWGIAKFFFPWILPDVSKGIVLDTDMIFVQNPMLMWDKFWSDRSRSWIYKMPLMNLDSSHNICSCVVMMDLAKARAKKVFPDVIRPILERHPYLRGGNGVGDQALYFWMQKMTRFVVRLPDMWNVGRCHKYNGIWRNKSQTDQQVGILHRNCAVTTDIFNQKDEASPFFNFWKEYKWEWISYAQDGIPAIVTSRNGTG